MHELALIDRVDVAIVGAGAAGLFAAIWAARVFRAANTTHTVLAIDGARRLGAKVLVAGGGRCNVTHDVVDDAAYAGSTRPAIRKVLRAFDVARTVAFFSELDVELKREETGKLFPVTDDARTVLNGLLRAAQDAGVELRHPWRVQSVRHEHDGFVIEPDPSVATSHDSGLLVPIRANRVIVATGGMALPRSGSDGLGYLFVRELGHTTTSRIFPALVPITLDKDRTFIPSLSGLTLNTTITLWSGTGKKLVEFTNSTLCTHFGLSGPSVLDISRYVIDARRFDPAASVTLNWIPGETFDALDARLAALRARSVGRFVFDLIPERLGRAICTACNIDASMPLDQLRKDDRRTLALALTRTVLPITGDRGFTHAEVTAGGVPLAELHLDTMESRTRQGLHLCGEICDVDGRIGGFNFQWAWASGYLAGRAAALATLPAES